MKVALPSALIALLWLACPPAHGQLRDRMSNPAIKVSLLHAPELGIQTKRIAFGPATGPCSEQLIDMVTTESVQQGIEVIDRQHLDSILAEHKFNFSGYVDQKTAAELGRILGPTTLLFIKVQRCAPEKKSLYDDRRTYDKNNPVVRVYISRTQLFLQGSVQAVDLASGRIFASRMLQANPSRQNEAQEGRPEFPSEFELQDEALRQASGSIQRMFFPWTEFANLVFFDDNDCNLKAAHQLMKAGDSRGAHRVSVDNLAACRTLPKVEAKTLGHAHYNVGLTLYALGDYDKALESFAEAAKLRPGDIVENAISLCSRARDNQVQMQRQEQQMALEVQQQQRKAVEKVAQENADKEKAASKMLTVKEIVAMRAGGLSEDLIATRIRKENRAFDLSTEDMLELKKNGISESLIKVMLDPTAQYVAPAKKVPKH